MSRRSRMWFVLVVLFTLLNLVGAVMAAREGQMWPHAFSHVALAIVGALVAWWLAPKREGVGAIDAVREDVPASVAVPRELTDRLTNLEHSVDAVALEVERIGEGQRFVTRVMTEKVAPQSPDAGASEPSEPQPR